MQATEFCVNDLVNSDKVIFGDSSDVVQTSFDSGDLDESDWIKMENAPTSKASKEFTIGYKLEECSEEFLESIRAKGIKNPIAMLDNTIMDGHHRLAAARYLGIKVPVMVYDSWEEFDNNHRWEIPGTCHSDGEVFTEYL